MPSERTTQILALDLGKFKSVACLFDTVTASHHFATVPTTPGALRELWTEQSPDRLVIEIGPAAGAADALGQVRLGARLPSGAAGRGEAAGGDDRCGAVARPVEWARLGAIPGMIPGGIPTRQLG